MSQTQRPTVRDAIRFVADAMRERLGRSARMSGTLGGSVWDGRRECPRHFSIRQRGESHASGIPERQAKDSPPTPKQVYSYSLLRQLKALTASGRDGLRPVHFIWPRRDSPVPKASGCLSAQRELRSSRKGPSAALPNLPKYCARYVLREGWALSRPKSQGFCNCLYKKTRL